MQIDQFFLSDSQLLPLVSGKYNGHLVALSLFVAVLAGIMAIQLASIARSEARQLNRQIALLSGAFVLGSGVWSMHFIGMLAYSTCSQSRYDPAITLLSMLPSFLASWIALLLLSKKRISPLQLVFSGISVGLGIGTMHYVGMMAIHTSLVLRFDPVMFAASIVVAVGLSMLALWLRFGLSEQQRFHVRGINVLSGTVLGVAITGMHHTGMAAARFMLNPQGDLAMESNLYLALSIAGSTILAILVTGGVNVLLRFRSLYLRTIQNEARIRTIVETAVDGIITIDGRGMIRAFNPAAEKIFGWPADSVVGRNFTMLLPAAPERTADSFLSHLAGDSLDKAVGTVREINGMTMNGAVFPIRLAIGKAVLPGETLFVGFVTDLSERHRMEEALRSSEQHYRSLIGNLPGTAFRCRYDRDWTMLFISDAVLRLTGWPSEEFISGRKVFVDVIHRDDRERVAATIASAVEANQPYLLEYRVVDRSGHEHWVSESASGVRDASGTIKWIDGVIIDVSESKRRNAEFEGIVNALGRSVALVEFALDGTILDANANFLAITGYSRDELIGKPHAMLCSPEDLEDNYYQLWETLRQGIYTSGDFHRIGKGGKDIWIHGSYNPIFDPDGMPYKVIKFANDLSERHAMEQDLRHAKARAELAAHAKSTFLANMSHEIRTPMNAILGFTEVLLSEPATESQQRHLTTVRNSARSLLRLLNDILDTAKLEHGAMDLETHDFSLRDVCSQVIAALRVNAQAKGLQLDLDYPATVPEFFKGDALRLQQVLINLVGNAIKFTDRGRVSLDVRHAQGEVQLCITDTGIGIAPDRLARIFDPFAQADASMTRRFGGTGLGTTIARQLIEIMGGRIWVESELGIGSRFYIAVPLPAGAEVTLAQDKSAIALPPLNILVADDVPQNLELLQIMLGRLGHRTTTASNGREAVQAFAQGRYDLVLMDVQMPVLDGLEATREIRRIEAGAGRAPTPVIALTASVMDQDAQAAHDAGMNGFASKPVEVFGLTREIARVLNIAMAPEDADYAADADHLPSPSALQSSTIDWRRGKQLWGNSLRHLAAVRRFLLDDADIVDRLRERLGHPAALRVDAHRLKGAAGHLALPKIAELGRRLENDADCDSRDIAVILDLLTDELRQVQQALVQQDPVGARGPSLTTIDHARLSTELERLDDALAHGELPEASLAIVAGLLPPEQRDALDHAIDTFDFDAARQVISNLRQRYGSEGVAR